MQSKFKLKFLCLLWLTLLQVQAQDIEPDFPEEFDTTNIATIGTTSGPATELPATTTRSEPAVEPSTDAPSTTTTTTIATTTEAEATTESPLKTTPATTTAEAEPSTTPYRIISRNSISWDDSDENEKQRCYLSEQDVRILMRLHPRTFDRFELKACYRCYRYGNGGFAGCRKVKNGPFRKSIYTIRDYYFPRRWELHAPCRIGESNELIDIR